MRVIGVLDLVAGRAVHARAGRRDAYQRVRPAALPLTEAGDALALAQAYVERLGLTELYAADLDAIAGGAPQDTLVASLAAVGRLWLDAGVSSADRARAAVTLGAAHVVVGLETLTSYEALENICGAVGRGRVAFSLDLRDGQPLQKGAVPLFTGGPAHRIAARAADAGVGAVIVIDLARVGMNTGFDLELIRRVRAAAPDVTLMAGGGVRGAADLEMLAEAGCDGALVATALHDGRISAADVSAALRHGSFTR